MKTLYFAAPSGISGNMTLAALLEIIEDDNYLLSELKKLHLDGYEIIIGTRYLQRQYDQQCGKSS